MLEPRANFRHAQPMHLDDELVSAATVADGSPCGPNLEYAAGYLEFVSQSRGRPQQQLGDSVVPAQEPDWPAVYANGIRLLRETRDLRIATIVTQAATHLNGISGLAWSLGAIAHWVNAYWDDLHPRLVIDDDYDPLMRSNAIAALCDPAGLIRSLRGSPCLIGRTGQLTVGDVESILKGSPPAAGTMVSSPDELSRLVATERERNSEQFAWTRWACASLRTIENCWRERLPTEFWPDLGLLKNLLDRLETLATETGADKSSVELEENGNRSLEKMGPCSTASALPHRVDSRAEAFRALAVARAYFEYHEPSHPAPLLIKRIERLMDLDFAAILAELTPEGLAQLQLITGSPDGRT